MRTGIFTLYHYVPNHYVTNDLYRPMVVGQRIGAHPALLSDESGDNIAHENSYAEMRGHYHVWKNSLKDYDFVGFQHYRRWLLFDQMPSTAQNPLFVQFRRLCARDPHVNDLGVDEPTFKQFLDVMQRLDATDLASIRETIARYDIVTVRPLKFSVADQYRSHHVSQDWDKLLQVISKHSRFRNKSNYFDPELQAFYACNMFVMSAPEFDAYMTFWREAMQEFAHLVKPYSDAYQSRVYGFISERIFSLYLFQLRTERPGLKLLEIPKIIGPQQTAAGASPSPAPSASPARPPVVTGLPINEVLTQEGPNGVRFDFNEGCRISCPESSADWQVRLRDLGTGNILYETKFKAGRVNSTARYFVRFRFELLQNDKLVFEHEYSAKDREVLIRFPVDTLGDVIGWFPYAVKFKEKHACKLTCAMEARLADLFRDSYPDITFITMDQIDPKRYYATYTLAVFFKQGTIYDYKDYVPCDFRFVGLHRAAGYILGVDPAEVPPRIALKDSSRPIKEPYVCIAVQSTLQAKYWNNPNGWREIVEFLKAAGYRVICIDQKSGHGKGNVWTQMPAGAEDDTGAKPLLERARYLKHADFFVGLSSGLSWLAWAMGTPVVMISGLTHPLNEFSTSYRVINYHVCNSCWNDPKSSFSRDDFMSCPRHQNTPRQFECTRLITAGQVKAEIMKVPAFNARIKKPAASTQDNKVTFNPSIFDVANIDAARSIILTAEGSATTDQRWRVETPYICDLIEQNIKVTSETTLLDYGCGIGRIAKELIERHACSVVGVDISESMRQLASQYVQSDRFSVCSPEKLEELIQQGQRFDAAISVWTLQHCFRPQDDVDRIKRALKAGAGLFVVNNIFRVVPTIEKGWTNDGIDIKPLLVGQFAPKHEGTLAADKVSDSVARAAFWAAFSNGEPTAA